MLRFFDDHGRCPNDGLLLRAPGIIPPCHEWSSQENREMIGRLHFLSNNYDFNQIKEKATYKSTVEMLHNVSSKEHKLCNEKVKTCTYHHHNCGHTLCYILSDLSLKWFAVLTGIQRLTYDISVYMTFTLAEHSFGQSW